MSTRLGPSPERRKWAFRRVRRLFLLSFELLEAEARLFGGPEAFGHWHLLHHEVNVDELAVQAELLPTDRGGLQVQSAALPGAENELKNGSKRMKTDETGCPGLGVLDV